MRSILVVFVAIVIVALLALGTIYLGAPDVAASTRHWPLTEWVLSETMDHSVRRQSKGISVPQNLASLQRTGFQHFSEMCVTCHGAPGAQRSEIGMGLNPGAPSLVAVLDDWKPEELFWIVKNGIKMTGMPAFGKTHTDEQVWAIVAFLLTLSDLTPEQYLAMQNLDKGEETEAVSPDTTR